MPEMVAPRALDSYRRPDGSWTLGTRMVTGKEVLARVSLIRIDQEQSYSIHVSMSKDSPPKYFSETCFVLP